MVWIRIRKDRTKKYQVGWRDKGGKRHSVSFVKKPEAVEYKAKLDLHQESVSVMSMDFETAACMYIDNAIATTAERTAQRYLGVLRNFMAWLDRPIIVSRITEQMITNWRNDRRIDHEATTVRNDLKCLRTFFAYAHQQEWCATNPATKVKTPRVKRKIPPWIDAEETTEIIEKLREFNTEYYMLALFAVRAGLRRNEIINLTWDNIDFGDRAIYVIETKSRNPRIVPMHKELQEALQAWPQVGKWVFPEIKNTATGHRSPAISKTFNKWLKDNGYSVRLHGLRHSFASQVARGGASEEVIRSLLGHTGLEMTRMYTHARDRDRIAAVDALE